MVRKIFHSRKNYSRCLEFYYRFYYSLGFDPLHRRRGSIFIAREQWAKSRPPRFLPPDLPMSMAARNVPAGIGHTWCMMVGSISIQICFYSSHVLFSCNRAGYQMGGRIFRLREDPVILWTAIIFQVSQSNRMSHLLTTPQHDQRYQNFMWRTQIRKNHEVAPKSIYYQRD